jgi:hypothetical protein
LNKGTKSLTSNLVKEASRRLSLALAAVEYM